MCGLSSCLNRFGVQGEGATACSPAEEGSNLIVPAPSGDAFGTEQLGECHLWGLITLAPDLRHHLGALGFSEDVSHQ